MRRLRRFVIVFVLLAGIVALVAGVLLQVYGPRLERAIATRLETEASRRGLAIHAESVRVALFPPIRVDDLSLEHPGLWQARIANVDVSLRLWGQGRPGLIARCSVGRTVVSLPAGLVIEAGPSVWDVRGFRSYSAELREPTEGLGLDWDHGGESQVLALHAANLQASMLAQVLQDGAPVADPGLIDGDVKLDQRASGELSVDLRLRGRGVQTAELAFTASLRPRESTFDVPRWHLATGAAEMNGRASVAGGTKDPRVDVSLDVERLDFARLFAASGLNLPTGAADLGSMALAAQVSGRLADPASLVVNQRLDFTPPVKPPDALLKLRGGFVHEVPLPNGGRRMIEVSPASPDFVSRDAVPPLFVRTLLLGEDTGFYGHRGVDLSEVVAAVATSWSKGTPMRGASTLTQQLAKNLFLSRERSFRRKLQELALALLLESTLGKERILEIYLNVIEWGPGIYGLRPAARHYFGKEPADLTPKEMAFLVALIPGPIKYQRSFAQGALTPGFEPLVANLLAKLHSVGELSDEDYEAALAETLVFKSAEDPPSGPLPPNS
jgi:Transglycosylase